MSDQPARQTTFSGVVVSSKMAKTLVVAVNRYRQHPKYGKRYVVTSTFHVDDPRAQFHAGEAVRFVQCRPISKTKRWRVIYGR